MKNFLTIIKTIFIFVIPFNLFCQVDGMKPLAYQIGSWQTKKVLKTQDGRKFQFSHELKWFDKRKSIAKLIIKGIFENGEEKLFWDGFKNWDASTGQILYVGMSPDGRAVRGTVEVVSDQIIKTIFQGQTPNGQKALIEDIATYIDENQFRSETYLKMEGEENFKLINTDEWFKVSIPKFDDKLN